MTRQVTEGSVEFSSSSHDTEALEKVGSCTGGTVPMPMSAAKGKEEWLKDVQGITSKTECVNELTNILAQKSKSLSDAQKALNQALIALDQRTEELVKAELNSRESDHQWQLMKVAPAAATA